MFTAWLKEIQKKGECNGRDGAPCSFSAGPPVTLTDEPNEFAVLLSPEGVHEQI